MSERQHTALGVAVAALILIPVAVVVVSCGPPPPRPVTCIYAPEALTQDALQRIADTLPALPANPWPCVREVYLGEPCSGTHGCYEPDERRIRTEPAALAHELAHAAAECDTGDPDYGHTAEWWRAVR